jgi:hypothetical protein
MAFNSFIFMDKENDKNPYPRDTQKWRIFEVLKDLKWHCSEHELPGSQPAKAIQMMRQDGFEFEKVGANWEKRMFCKVCNRKTPFRRLKSLTKTQRNISRINMSNKLRRRIIEFYGGKDEILGYKPTGRSIEIDHRVPQIRWKKSEEFYSDNISNEEIKKKFILLTREHNLLKSRFCEKCVRTGKRQPLFGIKFFFEGDEDFNNKLGCIGCGWNNPAKWKEELNKLAQKKEKE